MAPFLFAVYGLFQRIDSRTCHHAVLLRGAAGCANRTDDLAIGDNRHAAFNRHRATEAEDAQAGAATGDDIFKHLGRAAERDRRFSLVGGLLAQSVYRCCPMCPSPPKPATRKYCRTTGTD